MAGGYDAGYGPTDRAEVLEHGPPQGGWRYVGVLPSPRGRVWGATVGGVFHVAGGYTTPHSIVSYDPETRTWGEAGTLHMPRYRHGGTAVSLEAMQRYCPELTI